MYFIFNQLLLAQIYANIQNTNTNTPTPTTPTTHHLRQHPNHTQSITTTYLHIHHHHTPHPPTHPNHQYPSQKCQAISDLQFDKPVQEYTAQQQQSSRRKQESQQTLLLLPAQLLPDATLDKNKLGSDQVQIIQTNLVDSLLPADVQLNFALIDVEKMEVKALRGMRKIIDRSPNLVMMVQWQYGLNPNANQSQTVELLTWMIEKGYRIYTYMGGDNRKCKLGWFLQETNIQKILKIKFADLFFFPSSVPLPN